MKTVKLKEICWNISFLFFVSFFFTFSMLGFEVLAQSGLEGQIYNTINDLVRIINVLVVGFIVWAGFLIAKGDGSGVARLIYGVLGLVVVNSAPLIISYFR
ncbi:MAG: hypothetical protein KDD35_07995 [Bdellovibrionales bacterium]|nr:hypothetical protein [Bdellovibrionales bacterium]